MKTKFEYGDEVRVMRNVRNDGTYAGLEIGDHLVKRGSTGFVTSVGTFLQDQIIYGVHFLSEDKLVGCREEELIYASQKWIQSKFEFRDKVISKKRLAVSGEVLVELKATGEVLKVIRDENQEVSYHVRFPGITLQVPESALDIDPEYEERLKSREH